MKKLIIKINRLYDKLSDNKRYIAFVIYVLLATFFRITYIMDNKDYKDDNI